MGKTILIVATCLAFYWMGIAFGRTEPFALDDTQEPLLIADLEPKLDGEIVTIKFTVTELGGIAQLSKPGEAPWFAIETEKGSQKNMLSVWIIEELANVLNRLQLAAFQENALKPGTVIVATGKLTVHKTIPNQYFFNISQWQDFRILPSKPEK